MQATQHIITQIGERLLADAPPIPDPLVPDWMPPIPHDKPPVPAAVLIALVERGDQYSVLYTERSLSLRAHSGQIAFPGGKIDADDAHAAAAAIREAGEEVAIRADDVEVLGYLPQCFTGTNYLITPVVALVRPGASFVPNPDEVTAIFEVPLRRLMRSENYGTHYVSFRGREHSTWKVQHERWNIWGITANLTRQFYEMALAEGDG